MDWLGCGINGKDGYGCARDGEGRGGDERVGEVCAR